MVDLKTHRRWRNCIAVILVLSSFVVQSIGQASAPARLSAAEADLTDKITIAAIKDMTAALSAPDMEGRGTGQPGGDKAANWIADKFRSFGLKPLGDKGTYLQRVEFKETVATAETAFTAGDQNLAHGTEFALLPQHNGNKTSAAIWYFFRMPSNRSRRRSTCSRARTCPERSP